MTTISHGPVGCSYPRCRRAPVRVFTLRGRASGTTREWYGCPRHAAVLREMIRALWQRYDSDGVMALAEADAAQEAQP